jgi:DNA-binding LytR/AlgR family response regulator
VRIHRSRLVQRAQIAQVESKPSGDYVVRLLDGANWPVRAATAAPCWSLDPDGRAD